MIERFNLATARDRQVIAATLANPVESVSIPLFSVNNNTCLLHKGQGAEGYIISQEGQTWEFDPPWTDGIFITTPGGGAGSLDVAVEFRTYQAPQPVVVVNGARSKGDPGRFMDQLLKNFGLK